MVEKIIIATICMILIILLVIILITRKTKPQQSPKKEDTKDTVGNTKIAITGSDSYISPQTFDVGLIREKKYKSANLCNENVLRPINGLGVEYGWKMPDNCPCTQFVESI